MQNAMKILVLDNYDSFTYNLVHLLRELGHGPNLTVTRNDQLTLEAVDAYDAILLSPGPGIPPEAGLMPAIIRAIRAHQAHSGRVPGPPGPVRKLWRRALQHSRRAARRGQRSRSDGARRAAVRRACPRGFRWGATTPGPCGPSRCPPSWKSRPATPTAKCWPSATAQFDVRGVQFHPESILTEHGAQMLENWLA